MSCIKHAQWRFSFEGQQYTISNYSLASPRNSSRGMREGGIYMLLANLVALLQSSERLDEESSIEKAHKNVGAPRSLVRVSIPPKIYASDVASISSIHEPYSFSLEERCDILMEDYVEIDFWICH
jgi:hypothetical protein